MRPLVAQWSPDHLRSGGGGFPRESRSICAAFGGSIWIWTRRRGDFTVSASDMVTDASAQTGSSTASWRSFRLRKSPGYRSLAISALMADYAIGKLRRLFLRESPARSDRPDPIKDS